MTTPAPPPSRFTRWVLAPAKHCAVVVVCLWALWAHLAYRIPGSFVFILLPWVSVAILSLKLVLLIRAAWADRPDDPPNPVWRVTEFLSTWLVRAFVYGSLMILLNGALDQSMPSGHETEVVEVGGNELDVGVRVPYRWAVLRSWDRPGSVVRILLWPQEAARLWGGQEVLVRLRQGYFGVPWVERVVHDEGRYYAKVLERSSHAKLARYGQLKFYFEQRRMPEAVTAGRRYFEMYPDDYEFANQLALAFGGMGMFKEMLEILEPFVARRQSYEVYTLAGLAMSKVGRKQEAVRLLEAAVPMEPGNWWAYYFLGYTYGALNRHADAIAAFEKTLEIRPDFPEVRAELQSLRTLHATLQAIAARKKSAGSAPPK